MYELLLFFVGFNAILQYTTEEAAHIGFQSIQTLIAERYKLKSHIGLQITDEFHKTVYFASDKFHGGIVRPKEEVDNLRALQIDWYEETIKQLKEQNQGDSWRDGYDKKD